MVGDDQRHVARAETFVREGAWVPQLALAEAIWALSSVYARDQEAVADAIEMLLNHEHLAIQDAEVVAAAVVQFRRSPKVGFSDCLMLEIARKAGHLPLGTFDRDLGKLEGAAPL